MNNEGRVELTDGEAMAMGDGVVVVLQRDGKDAQSVVLTRGDLERLLAIS